MPKKEQSQTPPPAQPAPAPQKQGLSTGAKVAIGFGIGCLVIIIVAIILVATGCSKFVKEVNKNVSGSLSPSPTPTPTIQYVFDATSLLGKSVTDIRSALGAPTTTKASQAAGKKYSDEYVKGDASLRYDYTTQSEAINKFYLVLTKNGTLTNYVTTYNLKEGDSHYEIDMAEAVRPEDKAQLQAEGSDYIYVSYELK